MSGTLIPIYRQMHDDETAGVYHFPGRSVLQHAWIINQLIRKHDSRTLLDYGCGLGFQYSKEGVHKWWGIKPHLYDPAVKRYAARPEGEFDGVICADVMEHVPRDEVPAVLKEVTAYATQWVFFSICCRPASRMLPNGANAHCTLLPEKEWEALIRVYGNPNVQTRIEFTP